MTFTLLHTSDWHLGRAVARRSYYRTDEFDAVLAEIANVARRARPDAIVHSGDLFDVSRPGVDDLARAARVLRELAGIAPTVVVSGNHDSPGLFAFLDLVIGRGTPGSTGRLAFVHAPGGEVLDVPAQGGSGRIRLAALPFVHSRNIPGILAGGGQSCGERPDDGGTEGDGASYRAGMRAVQDALLARARTGHRDEQDALVLVAHVFISGAQRSASERAVDTDEAYALAPADLPAVDYGALGHIHRPQLVRGTGFPAYYAGSPLQMDFGEGGDTKSVALVRLTPGREPSVELCELTSGRPMLEFNGTLELLRARAGRYAGAYLKATVTSEHALPDFSRLVAEAVPDALIVECVNAHADAHISIVDGQASSPAAEPELPDSFRAYLADITTPGANADAVHAAFTDLLSLGHDTAAPHPVEQQLQAALDNPWQPNAPATDIPAPRRTQTTQTTEAAR
jgi:exonuclease SbcD